MTHRSIVHPSFELDDPCPDIHSLFLEYNERFFWGALACCEVKWSPRMYSCAGICSYEVRGGRGGLCSIRLSLPLLKLRPRKDLVETLLHEMIHAFLFVKERNRDRDGHGPQFQAHMHRINNESGTNITIYHSFHNEVALYKQHVWRCDGVCKNKRPFFGYVKRSSNRAPGPNDLWWAQHQFNCGGSFIKIKEPEGYGQKKRKTKKENVVPEKKKAPQKTLDDYYGKNKSLDDSKLRIKSETTSTGLKTKLGGKNIPSGNTSFKPFAGAGQRLGGTGIKNKKTSLKETNFDIIVLDSSDEDDSPSNSETKAVKLQNSDKSDPSNIGNDEDDDLEISFVAVTKTNNSATMVICPSCNEKMIEEVINDHLDHCLG